MTTGARDEVAEADERDGIVSDVAAGVADAEEADDSPPVESYTTAIGVVLRFKPVPPFILSQAATRVPKPEPPQVWIESKQQHEPNPASPHYQQMLNDWREEGIEAGVRVALILGTEVAEIPDGVPSWDDEAWVDQLREAASVVEGATGEAWQGPEIGEPGTKRRYLDWLRYYALASEEDLFSVSRIVTHVGVLTEEELTRAVDSFRSTARLISDLGVAVAASAKYGADLESDAGDRG